METGVLPGGAQYPESGEWDPVEKSTVEMVNKRRMKVERLERELDALRKYVTKLFESFSVPTFPEGYDPVAERLGDEYLNDSVPPSHAAGSARGLKQRKSPSSRIRKEAGFADGGDIIEGAVPTRIVGNRISSKTLSSSKPSSTSMEARDFMDLTIDNEIDLMKDEIRRVRPGVKSPQNSPAKTGGMSARVPEKKRKTGHGSNDDLESSFEGSSSESSDGELPIGTSDEDSSDKESPSESSDGEIPIGSSDEESSGNEGSESASEDSDESESDPPNENKKIKPSGSDPEEMSGKVIPSSSASDCLTEKMSSPAKMKRDLSGEKAKTTWQPKNKAPSSSSEDSEESSSSSDEDTGRNKRHAQSGRASLGRAREPVAPKAVSALSSDASPEERFDWIILGLQGPWLPLASVENGSGASELKDQSLPLKFPSMTAYIATFQKLIGEEAKAILLSEWEMFKAEQDLSTEQSLNVDSRGQSLVWRLRSMVRTMGDPFHYFEAESRQGNIKLDVGEFLCMIVPGTEEVKAVAIVYHQDRLQAPLLRTRTPWDFSLDECVLLRLCNMVTLRRMFLAVSTLSELFSPLQQQILNPLANIKFLKPSPTLEDSASGDSKPKLSLESLRNFSDRKILNTLQLLAVSSLLHMRQGFQLVQGPPGTGKVPPLSTLWFCSRLWNIPRRRELSVWDHIYYCWRWHAGVIGMVSTLLIEEPGVRILVCAPSNAALDEIAARLMYGMWDKSGNIYSPIDGSIVRFGAHRVIHPIVQLISLDSLTVRLSSSSSRSRAWVDILDGASVVCATLSGCGSHTFDELEKMFDVVVIDEAAQAVEAEVLIALKRVRGRCVMVGDPQQLPATIFQRPSVAYGRSLFERFQEGGNPVHMLTTQYRMHPSICIYPSKQFYGGALTNSSRTSTMRSIFSEEVCDRGITVRGCKFKLGHYCFMDVGWGSDREELVGHSRANFEEALVVCNVVEGAVKGLLPGRKPNVGVITPYIAQRGVIESQLERRGIDTAACEVNTVDGFQGREKDVIVLSCVRAMADRGLGFVSDEKRMNVALTRAKYSLIIVGHAMTLRKWSATWEALIEDARKRGCYQVLKNEKNQDVPPSNWNQSSIPRKDLNDTVEAGNTPQVSRKRSLNGTERCLPNKEYSKPTTTDTNSNKHAKDSGEARENEEHTQTLRWNFKTGGVEENPVCKNRVKRKRKSIEIEAGKKFSVGLERAPNSAEARDEMLRSFTVEKEVNVAANSPDLVPPPKKKKKQQAKGRFPEPPVLGKVKVELDVAETSAKSLRKKKVKVELEAAEPSVTKRSPIKLKAVKQEFPTDQKRKLKPVICLPAPALSLGLKRKGKQTARSLEKEPEPLLKPPTKETTTSAQEEEIVQEVTSSVPTDCAHTWRTSQDANNNENLQSRDEAPADPVPQGTDNWRSAETQRQSRGWFPNSVPEDDRHIRQLHLRSVHTSVAANSTQGFPNFDEYGSVDSRQPHWGNSYVGAAPGPQNRFHAHELDISTDNMYSVLTRPNNYAGMQPNTGGNLQQVPRTHWQHPSAVQRPPHGHQFSGHQFSNLNYEQPPWPRRQPHSAPPQKKWTRSESAASAPHWKARHGHRGRRGRPGR